jgi:hypothetical protein
MEKLKTYFRVRSSDEPNGKPVWQRVSGPPTTKAGLVGDVVVENDDQVMTVYFEDHEARRLVTRKFKDAAALAQEHMIPHRPAAPESVLPPIEGHEQHD